MYRGGGREPGFTELSLTPAWVLGHTHTRHAVAAITDPGVMTETLLLSLESL